VLMHPYFRDQLARAGAVERGPGAEGRRRVRSAAGAGPERGALSRLVAPLAARMRRHRGGHDPAAVRVRFATEHDRRTWPDLEPDAPEHLLVADVDGAPRAALSLVDGAVLRVGESGRARRR
jgi:hypothetical protein